MPLVVFSRSQSYLKTSYRLILTLRIGIHI
uniref:Uncharacterized protein n=1 Tax=Siphoviridae sp. cttFh17 TaxID=2826491 RepID=A0A8S5NIP2_9CAUD|nr:MAG TPA: hypothetical protein [Siphoviridae sp. cttFh17]